MSGGVFWASVGTLSVVLALVWGNFWLSLADFWRPLAPLWGALGRTLGDFGALWLSFGSLWEALGDTFGTLRRHWGHFLHTATELSKTKEILGFP